MWNPPFLIWTWVFVVYIAWGALDGTFRCSTWPQKLEDLRIESFLWAFLLYFIFFQASVMLPGNRCHHFPCMYRQRDESHQCSKAQGAQPASNFSRRLPVLYSFLVSGEGLIHKLWKFKASANQSLLSLAGNPQEEEPKSHGHLWKWPFEKLPIVPWE